MEAHAARESPWATRHRASVVCEMIISNRHVVRPAVRVGDVFPLVDHLRVLLYVAVALVFEAEELDGQLRGLAGSDSSGFRSLKTSLGEESPRGRNTFRYCNVSHALDHFRVSAGKRPSELHLSLRVPPPRFFLATLLIR